MEKTKKLVDDISFEVIGAAIDVHKALGPGLLESVYHKCMAHELGLRGIPFISEMTFPIEYKGLEVEAGLRFDLFVQMMIVVEFKAVECFIPIHYAQLLTYMKLLEAPKGILINFNCEHIFRQGQKSFVNEFYTHLPAK